ncbi:hypothetical protein BDZ89DRAFT_1073048 [Hymenopellis radicata]|nr:hypothetical protein BDZ89DRAFT_1073048 [Hymenopellis radicata]
MPALLNTRDENSEVMSGSSSLRPVYIAGFCVVGAILIGLAIWLSIRIYRRRAQAKRDNVRGAAFLSVKGLVRVEATEKEPLPENLQALKGGTFSRDQLTRNRGSVIKADRSSFLSVGSRNSIMSTLSASSIDSSASSSATARKVRQVFNPILPDELTVSPGERLTLVQSFDDGWCVVGRESRAAALGNARSLFKAAAPQQDDDSIELGVIPAWCFIKPAKGLKAERPVRSSSLGPGFSSREELISWSNF